jgi:hypothetical protein
MALQDITITGSIGTYPTLSYGQKMYVSSTDEESFPIEEVIGSNGGSMPNLFGQTSSIDLYSPINQQWSGSTLTPVGIVNYIHSSQDEFINGELSGSALEVSHQSLVDKDCEVYLTVDTTPTTYKPFIYNAIDTPLSLGEFLNANTSPNNGEIYIFDNKIITQEKPPSGFRPEDGIMGYRFKGSINYIKINIFDIEGEDNTLSLQELTNLRIKFSDLGIVDFPILTITEYPTYYLFLVNKPISYDPVYFSLYIPWPGATAIAPSPPPTPYTVDNNVIMHQLVASAGSYYLDFYSPTGQTGTSLTVSIDNNSCFNPTTGNYTFKDTPNVLITFTGSITFNSAMEGSIGLYQNESGTSSGPFTPIIVVSKTISTSFPSGYNEITGSFVPVEGNIYSIRVINLNSDGSAVTTNNLTWVFTQSMVPHSSSNLTVLEPYLVEDFYYNDCNVLFGNVLNLEYDSNFYQVNYDNGSIIPSNQTQIINRTAELAPVKSYNYAARAQIYPRYVGTKVVQQNENIWTEGDISPSQTPSVQSLGTYFAYFEFAGGTNPELINKRGFKIKFLIDTSGSIIQPTLSEDIPYYNNLIDSFPGGKNVNIVPYVSTGDVAQIQGIQQVLQPGVIPSPLLYNQITSYNVITSSILFTGSVLVPDYNTSLTLASSYSYGFGVGINNILDTTPAPTPTYPFPPNTYFLLSTPKSIEITTIPIVTTKIIPTLTINLSLQGTSTYLNDTSVIVIWKDSGGAGTFTPIHSQTIVVVKGVINTYVISAPPQTVNSFDRYKVSLSTNSIDPLDTINQHGGFFTISQTTPPSSITLTPPYWTTGSSSRNILTGSTQINASVYGLIQNEVSGSGYTNSTLPFTVQRLDQIRFSADENQMYQILGVESPLDSIDGRLYLTLDRDIANGTDLNSFFLRRMYPDPTFVLMNVPAAGGGLSGFMYPEYITKELSGNLSSIITDLQQKNLI